MTVRRQIERLLVHADAADDKVVVSRVGLEELLQQHEAVSHRALLEDVFNEYEQLMRLCGVLERARPAEDRYPGFQRTYEARDRMKAALVADPATLVRPDGCPVELWDALAEGWIRLALGRDEEDVFFTVFGANEWWSFDPHRGWGSPGFSPPGRGISWSELTPDLQRIVLDLWPSLRAAHRGEAPWPWEREEGARDAG